MLKVGLTGGIACGKSTVLALFASQGARTLSADGVAHQLMAPGQEPYQQIVTTFGAGILAADGTISRPLLAQAAFPARIAELNTILHPPVKAFEDEWMRRIGEEDPAAVVLCEAALLIEAGGLHRFHRLIVVTCTQEQRVARFASRTGLALDAARAEVARRMASQMPEEEKARLADYVIDNSGTREQCEQAVHELWPKLKAEASLR